MQRNVEVRRAACEMIGWVNIIKQLQGRTIDQDHPEIGRLVRVKMPRMREHQWFDTDDFEDAQFLIVQCGTGREFALPVPETMRTAREANAWTYGLEPTELQPEVRT